MSADALLSAVTGDYSLDDFLDAGEREDPADDADEPDDVPAESDREPESASDPETPADSGTDASPEPPANADSDTDSPDDDSTAESGGIETESDEDDPIPPESVAPAEPTYGWSPDGAECTGCGETATTRWRQDGEYVCADCKEW
ncbi:hypothetical protein HUG10_11055 [Halorarum halophilum]|uniref:GATA-type domain-containing protein n=1 Tax=Halorarum halophilum TaxID=2743090 RepID=A0A7D5K869_9EURY|nr:hypothetical protein [Halobaculum halophilum]QLG28059.1 hypothetical protein HUG10_11055 [Halobaculum halophilum]